MQDDWPGAQKGVSIAAAAATASAASGMGNRHGPQGRPIAKCDLAASLWTRTLPRWTCSDAWPTLHAAQPVARMRPGPASHHLREWRMSSRDQCIAYHAPFLQSPAPPLVSYRAESSNVNDWEGEG